MLDGAVRFSHNPQGSGTPTGERTFMTYLRLPSASVCCLSILLTATTFAAGPDRKSEILTLADGGSIEGVVRKAKKKSQIRLLTPWGERFISAASVVARRPSAKVRQRYENRRQGLNAKDSEARLALARWCKTQGLCSGVLTELDAVLERHPAHPKALAMIKRLAPHYRLAKKNIQPREKPRWLRRESDLLFDAAAKTGPAATAMIRFQLEALPVAIQMNRAIDLVSRGRKSQRWISCHVLGRSNETRRVRPLYQRALADPSWQVRYEAVASLKKHDDGTTIGPFVKALLTQPKASTRAFAAEALEQLGDKRAVPPLLTALSAGGGRPSRNHLLRTVQTAYIKDFDVEIAQAAVIADPIVDVVKEGVVLEVAVVSVAAERRAVARSLAALTGARHGTDIKAWKSWWKQHKEEYAARLRVSGTGIRRS